MTDQLGHKQTAAVLTLMAVAREVTNPELRDLVGFTLDGKFRTELNSLGLVASRKQGRAYAHELTDAGWAWCADELRAMNPPPPHGTLSAALYVLLANLDRYLNANNLSLAEFFASHVEPADIETRIRTAHGELAGSPSDWVALAALRPKVGVPAQELDRVLKDLSKAKRVRLVPKSNRKLLTAADHQAAVRIGGEDQHLISIGAS